jgi:predicted GTPase
MGAAGRDFHNFLVCFGTILRPSGGLHGAQIPASKTASFPELSGPLTLKDSHSTGRKVVKSSHDRRQVVFAYSDLAHQEVMHKASRVLAPGRFRLLGPERTMLKAAGAGLSVAPSHRMRQKQRYEYIWEVLNRLGIEAVARPPPHALLRSYRMRGRLPDGGLDKYLCTVEEENMNAGSQRSWSTPE